MVTQTQMMKCPFHCCYTKLKNFQETKLSVDELVIFDNIEPIVEIQTSDEIIQEIVQEKNYNDSNVDDHHSSN